MVPLIRFQIFDRQRTTELLRLPCTINVWYTENSLITSATLQKSLKNYTVNITSFTLRTESIFTTERFRRHFDLEGALTGGGGCLLMSFKLARYRALLSTTGAWSSFPLKQLEQRSLFQAFWTNRGHDMAALLLHGFLQKINTRLSRCNYHTNPKSLNI